METVGKKVIKLDFAKGFSAQLATAVSVDVGTLLGLPLSTTHCMVGSLFGLVIASRIPIVQAVYPDTPFAGDVTEKDIEVESDGSPPRRSELEVKDSLVRVG